ncbi:MAG TPA: MFS transporter [Miltoncostaeaceae bacterium]|nr:MFS transporter [Miltoncostaeaceae bacterium]
MTAVRAPRRAASRRGASPRAGALALAVAVVLADSSIVILALPEILAEYDVTVARVAWVLTAYNLVLALAAVPAAYLARRTGPGPVLAAGLVLFAVASAGCALAPGLDWLIAARCAQALGGAAVVSAALEVMPAVLGSEARAGRVWAAAGALGLALGPAVGGALTQLISWQAIFVAQTPVIVLAGAVVGTATAPVRTPAGRPHLAANLALLLVSAALTAALFLLVLLLINGWNLAPIAAAATVSVMPVAAIAAGGLRVLRGSPAARAAAGTLALAGGLAALGLMPRAGVAWTIPPQVLVGVGLGLAVGALTESALTGRSPQALHGGWTMASRHAGVVLGILLLTPVFVADLARQEDRAQNAVTALLLDAPIAPGTKIELARAGAEVLARSEGRVPDLAPAFAAVTPQEDDRDDYRLLERRLDEQLETAGTASVARSFLAAALFALAALVPILIARGRVRL